MSRVIAACIVQAHWRTRMTERSIQMMRALRDMCVCSVCGDECVRHVRCPNGHGVCVSCETQLHDTRCPMCRVHRAQTVDAIIPHVLNATSMQLVCSMCRKCIPAAECERHRVWCPKHAFACPMQTCRTMVHGADMAAHMISHGGTPLRPHSNGEYTVVVPVTCYTTNEPCIFIVGSAVVVLRCRAAGGLSMDGPHTRHISVDLRAYYAGASAPALRAVLHQLLPSKSADTKDFLEEHRIGVVPPMLATFDTHSHTLTADMPRIVPRAELNGTLLAMAPVPDGRPGLALAASLRHVGITDRAHFSTASVTPAPRMDGVAVLYLRLTAHHRESIGSHYT